MIVLEDRPLTRKRKDGPCADKVTGAKKSKVAEDLPRSLSGGIWSPAFNLGHEIDFKLAEDEEEIVQNMSEQQLADATLEMACRTAVMNWHLAYASDRGKLHATLKESQDEVARLKLQLEEEKKAHSQVKHKYAETAGVLANLEKTVAEVRRGGRELLAKNEELTRTNGKHVATIESMNAIELKLREYGKHIGTACQEARTERDALMAKVQTQDAQIVEMGSAIIDEHTMGFKKALRQASLLLNVSVDGVGFDLKKDVYKGELVPLRDIPEEEDLGVIPSIVTEDKAGGEVVAEAANIEKTGEEDQAAPSKGLV